MTVVQRVVATEDVTRRVLFALELVDPVTQTVISDGLSILATGIDSRPVVSHSRRFVWLRRREDDRRWPTAIRITPHRLPFEPQEHTPRLPADPNAPTLSERLVRVTLRPTAAYPFDTGLTVLRGRLRESALPGSPAMPNVLVQLAWLDNAEPPVWRPAVPAPSTPLGFGEARTDTNGAFVAFLRLDSSRRVDPDDPDIDSAGLLKVRLQFTRPSDGQTRVTPIDYPFVPNDPDRPSPGRVPEGRLLSSDLQLAWSDLV